nr:PKD domain-containing protein [Chloroflexaceae bacterium]
MQPPNRRWHFSITLLVALLVGVPVAMQRPATASEPTTTGGQGQAQAQDGADGAATPAQESDRTAAWQQRQAALASAPPEVGETFSSAIYLPLVVGPARRQFTFGAMSPQANMQLEAGDYTLDSLAIPPGVTVSATGPVTLNVKGDVKIDGTLRSICGAMTINAGGNLLVLGTINNRCDGAGGSADVTLQTNGGALRIGGDGSTTTTIATDGNLNTTNAANTPRWEFDVLPHQRSSSNLPPVCTARADTLLDTVVPGAPVPVQFESQAADPDGGPMQYRWSFGDGGSSSEQNPTHLFQRWGAFAVTLTATDDDGQQCQARLHVVMGDGEANVPSTPAAQIELAGVLAEVGMLVNIGGLALGPQAGELSYAWDFGDGSGSSEQNPVHSYAAPGRYMVTLTVRNATGERVQSTAALYVYPPTTSPAVAPPGGLTLAASEGVELMQVGCIVPPPPIIPYFDFTLLGRKADDGKHGVSFHFWGIGFVVVGPRFNAQAQHGGDGRPDVRNGDAFGRNGGRGGDLTFSVNGLLSICGGAQFTSGNGGNGGDATARAAAPGMAWARAGHGGRAGTIWVEASQGIRIWGNITTTFG